MVRALDKLLIYEKDQFFSLHKDSEKSDNMLASLIVILPCLHKGGDLVISHRGETKVLKSSINKDDLQFFCFYSDCEHEIKKVTSGYRVALSYQIFTDSSSETQNTYSYLKQLPTSLEKTILESLKENISSYFEKPIKGPSWGDTYITNQKFVYLLNYDYTPKGLSVKALKGVDNIKFQLFKTVADKLHLDMHLALADMHECWHCSEEYSHEGWDDYDEHFHHESVDLEEIIDKDNSLNNWKTLDNKSVEYGRVDFYETEAFQTLANDSLEPYNEECEGYMGNYGNTMDRWYYRGAIVLWPKKIVTKAFLEQMKLFL